MHKDEKDEGVKDYAHLCTALREGFFTTDTGTSGNQACEAADVIEDLLARVEKEQRSYRCYCCKAVFEEDNGHGLAAEHFGRNAVKMRTKCAEFLDRRVGGGPHDPVMRALDVIQAKLEAAEQELDRLREAISAIWRAPVYAGGKRESGVSIEMIAAIRCAVQVAGLCPLDAFVVLGGES